MKSLLVENVEGQTNSMFAPFFPPFGPTLNSKLSIDGFDLRQK